MVRTRTQAGAGRPAGPPSPRPTARAGWVQATIGAVERTPALVAVAKRLTRNFSRFVRPGPVKDVLSGTWLGHPAHPLLTDVTIGAWTSALMLDLVSSRRAAAADTLIGLGVLSALPTAVTGLSDLSDVEAHDVRAIGAAHAMANVSATTLFAASWVLRRRGDRGRGCTLSLAATGVATAAGFLGGHLSYRRGIGVDRTAFDDPVRNWHATIRDEELAERPRVVRVGRNDVMLYRGSDGVIALADRCSHRAGPLHKGTVADGQVTCPWHGSTFRLSDGAILGGPATAPQPCYDARTRDGIIEVRRR